ncbi:MAG: helix-turn-helix domain-containing protein [Bacteroidales bacterium]|nr:helix-turn-helix domain-containing protein [Bacteroidales bacterium]
MDKLAPVRKLLQDLISPIVFDAVKTAMPKKIVVEPKPFLSVEEVEEEYHISVSSLYRRFDMNELTRYKNGSRTLVSRKEIEDGLKKGTLVAFDERGCKRGAKSK